MQCIKQSTVSRHKGKSLASQCARPTMIYDSPAKAKGYADFCASVAAEVFIPSRKSSQVYGGYRLSGNFPRACSIDNVFHGTRLHYFLDNYLDALFIVIISCRFNWRVEQFYYCSHHACSRVS